MPVPLDLSPYQFISHCFTQLLEIGSANGLSEPWHCNEHTKFEESEYLLSVQYPNGTQKSLPESKKSIWGEFEHTSTHNLSCGSLTSSGWAQVV